MSGEQNQKFRLGLPLVGVGVGVGLLIVATVGLLAWGLRRAPVPLEELTSQPHSDSSRMPDTPAALRLPLPSSPPANVSPSVNANHESSPTQEDTLLVNPADPDAPRPDGGPLRPHPITPQHDRIFRENQLIGALYGAMDVKDGPGVRKLADEYRREYPEDPNQLQQGYDIIADCLEHPGRESSAAGQHYYDVARGSILRRFVARHCLGLDL